VFYEPSRRDAAILTHDPFKALIAPRPIGWVTTMNQAGALNLAPYSYFNAFSSTPPILGFSSEGRKDSVSFVAELGEFVWNLPTFALRHQMNETSARLPRGSSEFRHAGLSTAPSRLVRPPRVAESPCAMECRLVQIIQLKDSCANQLDCYLVLGEVVGIHIEECFIVEGRVDTAALQPIARCGYSDYAVVDQVFAIRRPTY
jgi:flavin reductase (DIM6/NTAB) family NADH-FMN oxidoreductase RutF